jgi:hypothetical protein
MNRQNAPSSLLVILCLAAVGYSVTASGVDVYAGSGLGFSDDPNHWLANFVFRKADKKATKLGLTASFHTGQDLTPVCAAGDSPGCANDQSGLAALTVPATSSTGWCDATVNPITVDPNKFNVTAAFDEPAYNDIAVPRDTVFKGTFTWDAATKTLSNFRGTMNQVMVSSDQTLALTHLFQDSWSYEPGSDTVTATVFRNDSTAIFKTGGFDSVPGEPLTDGTSNAFFTLNFNASAPTVVTQENIKRMTYGDCIGGSLMNNGILCMTGLVPKGSMDGFPQSLTITNAAADSVSTGGCFGSALGSKWAVIDLNGLQKAGLRSVWIAVTASRYDDGIAEETDNQGHLQPGDDDLIPALTVFRGRQDVGVHGYWYPNQFQPNPKFWAWKLSPFYSGTASNDTTGGWATANGSASNHSASISGKYLLKPGNQNYLTVAVGGDGRDGPAAHDVNFELAVRVSRKPPPAN